MQDEFLKTIFYCFQKHEKYIIFDCIYLTILCWNFSIIIFDYFSDQFDLNS